MGLRVNTNLAAINAQRQLAQINERLGANFRHLATGLRIATAADDSAGLAISERLRAQIRSLGQAQRNANDGVSLIQTGEGAMNEVSNILVRMRELAVQSASGTMSDSDRDSLQEEFSQLRSEIDRIANLTSFNGIHMLDGTSSTLTIQVGAGTSGDDTLTLNFSDLTAATLGIGSLDIGQSGDPSAAIAALDTAINTVASARGNFGAVQNRLSSTIANLGSTIENFSAAESRIRDVDVATETADLTRNSILQQAAISILAQANIQPQSALALLG
ncbi:MAG: flagellin [Planctomycetota bacterium]